MIMATEHLEIAEKGGRHARFKNLPKRVLGMWQYEAATS